MGHTHEYCWLTDKDGRLSIRKAVRYRDRDGNLTGNQRWKQIVKDSTLLSICTEAQKRDYWNGEKSNMRNGWSNSEKKQREEAEDMEAPDKVVAGTDREGVVAKAAEATVAKAAEATVGVVKVAALVIEARSKEIVIRDQSAGVRAG